VDEGCKRVLLIAASILAARKLAQFDGGKKVRHGEAQCRSSHLPAKQPRTLGRFSLLKVFHQNDVAI
jgi:hypothetical protein